MRIKNNVKDLLLYLAVGGIATLTEWGIFRLGSRYLTIFHYTMLTVVAYVISTFVNWGAGRLLVFKRSDKPFLREISEIYISGILGLVLNLIIMFVCVDLLSADQMISKIIATGIVFFFNFLVRKMYIYKK